MKDRQRTEVNNGEVTGGVMGPQTIAAQNIDGEEDSIDILDLLMHLVEKWKIIVIAAIIGTLLMGIYSVAIAKPKYEATSKLYVLSNKDSAVNLSDLQLSSYLADDYQEVFKNWHVHELVMQRLGIDYSYEAIGKMIKITNPANTRILYITASCGTPVMAQAMANAYAEVAQEFIAVKMDTAEPSVFEEALLPIKPSSPKVARNLILGFIIGILIAVIILVIQYLMDDYLRTADDINKYIHIPVLGNIMLQDDGGKTQKRSAFGRRNFL